MGPTKFSFSISSLRNPFSTETSDSFIGIFKNKNHYAIAI